MRIIGLLISFGLGAVVCVSACDDAFTPTNTTAAGGAGGGTLTDAGSLSGLALINPVCGTGDGGTVSQACVECATDQCAAELSACFGTAWQTTLDGGICAGFGQCVMACPCGDNVCFNDCLQALDAAAGDPCRSCIVDLVACEQSQCDAECDTEPNSDAGSGGSGQGGHGGHGHGTG